MPTLNAGTSSGVAENASHEPPSSDGRGYRASSSDPIRTILGLSETDDLPAAIDNIWGYSLSQSATIVPIIRSAIETFFLDLTDIAFLRLAHQPSSPTYHLLTRSINGYLNENMRILAYLPLCSSIPSSVNDDFQLHSHISGNLILLQLPWQPPVQQVIDLWVNTIQASLFRPGFIATHDRVKIYLGTVQYLGTDATQEYKIYRKWLYEIIFSLHNDALSVRVKGMDDVLSIQMCHGSELLQDALGYVSSQGKVIPCI